MEQSGRYSVQEPASVSEPSHCIKTSESTVKRVSRQLAKPNVAGFQARLDKEDYNATLKHVSNDKIDVLLDEFMVDYGGRRASLIEELHAEDEVPLRELFYGEPGLMFGVVGEASTGKTSLLLHMHWRLNCRQHRVMKELKAYDTTWAYFQVPDSEAEAASPPIMTAAPPLSSQQQRGEANSNNPSSSSSTSNANNNTLTPSSSSANIAALNASPHISLDGSDPTFNSSDVSGATSPCSIGLLPYVISAPDSPKLPSRFLAIYTFGSELVRREVGPHGGFEIPTLLEAAYSTYLLRLPFGQEPVAHDDFINSYTSLITEFEEGNTQPEGSSPAASAHAQHHHSGTGIVLLVDGFDFVEQGTRASLLSSLAITLNPGSSPSLPAQAAAAAANGGLISPIFRIFFGSRPNGLFKIEELPDSVIFLCLDRLFSVDWKEKLLGRIAPEIQAEYTRYGREHVETKIQRRLLRSCHSPLLVFLLAQLRKIQSNQSTGSETSQSTPSPAIGQSSNASQQSSSTRDSSTSGSNSKDGAFNAYPNALATLPSEINACLYDMFENFFTLIVRQSKLVRNENVDTPKAFKISGVQGAPFELEEKEFFQLVDLVSFFYHCWTPETWRRDWSTRERFEHLMFYLFKHQSALLHGTLLGRLREHFLVQRARAVVAAGQSLASDDASEFNSDRMSTQNNDTSYVECAGALWMAVAEWLVSVGLAHRLTSTIRNRNRANSKVAANQASIQAILQSGPASSNNNAQLSSSVNASQSSSSNNNQQTGSAQQQATAEGSTTSLNREIGNREIQTLNREIGSLPMSPSIPASSGSSTPKTASSSYNFEILLKDEQQVQFQCARFLMNTELSGPILSAIDSARQTMRGFDTQYPLIFAWHDNYFLTNKHWNYIFDMLASKRGIVWLSKTILPSQVKIQEWLAQMRLNKGVDKDDLGQIRFYRLLRGFALQQEDRDLSSIRQREAANLVVARAASRSPQAASKSPHYSSSEYESAESGNESSNVFDRGSLEADASGKTSPADSNVVVSSPVASLVIPSHIHQSSALHSSRSTPKTAEEVEIADLKEAFGMTFVSILDDNPSAIVHIEKAPVSSLACFSQNAISIILDKMIMLLRQGNIFVVSDLLINLDRHGLVSNDMVHKVIELVTNGKDSKPIRPALRFLSSRTPAHRHLSAIISCLAAKDQDAQAEAMDALTGVAKTAVKLSKELFEESLHHLAVATVSSSSAPLSLKTSLAKRSASPSKRAANDSPSSQGRIVHNTTAFAPLDADHSRSSSSAKVIPDDMVITTQPKPTRPVEELFLLEAAHDSEMLAVSPPSGHLSAAAAVASAPAPTTSSPVIETPQPTTAPTTRSRAASESSHAASVSADAKAWMKRVPFLFEERSWTILLRSAISLLVDFVGLDLHRSTKNASYYSNVYEPRVRMLQCKHLASLIEMMESDEPGTRLLPFILLGTTIKSNDYDREKEKHHLEAQLCILDAIGRAYTSYTRKGDTQTQHDLVEEMARDSPINRGIGYVFHDLLGQQAAKYAVMSEELIKSKPDLLAALNSWAFARMNAEVRRNIFTKLSMHENLLVQQSILDLVCENRTLIEAMDPTDLTVVIASNFPLEKIPVRVSNPNIGAGMSSSFSASAWNSSSRLEVPISLKRAALRFLELSALATHSQDYRLHAIDKIVYLLSAYGFNDPVVTEPLLRILDTIMSTPVFDQSGGNFAGVSNTFSNSAPSFVSTFKTPCPYVEEAPRAFLTTAERLELYKLLQRNNMRQKLIQAFEAQSPKHFWTGKVLTCSLLRHFITPESEDALEYVHFLKSSVPEIRAIALSELHRIDASLVPALLQRLKELISYEEPLVRTTYAIVVGALGMRSEQQAMAIDVACYHMSKDDSPDIQQNGVSILSILGESVSESVLVAERFEQILAKKLDKLMTPTSASGTPGPFSGGGLFSSPSQIIPVGRLSVEENGLLMSMVDCITNIRLTTTPVLTRLLGLLKESPDPALRTAICLAFKRLGAHGDITSEQKMVCQEQVMGLLQMREGYVREIGIKLIRFFGRETIKHNASRLIKMISDPELYVRKQSIKAVTCLLQRGDEQAKKEALLLLPAVSSALEDKSPLVIVQALKFLVLLKSRTRSVSVTIARLAARSAREHAGSFDPEDEAQISIDSEGIPVLSSMPSSSSQSARPSIDRLSSIKEQLSAGNRSDSSAALAAAQQAQGQQGGSSSSASYDMEDDPWYVRKVIIPNSDRILSLLYRRRYRYNLAIKVGVLNCLGTTRLLGQHLGSFAEMLNSESVPTLVEFSDTTRRLGPGMLQYIPAIVNSIKPGSPLVRNMVRLLARYEKQMDARTCSRLFSLQTILSMMKNKDANVRKVAVSLMGKKVLEKSKHIWVIIQMWGDKNNKVRKEVMEVLGDIGKTNPQYISHIMNLIDTDSVSSVLVWRFLSKSWGLLIGNVPHSAQDDA